MNFLFIQVLQISKWSRKSNVVTVEVTDAQPVTYKEQKDRMWSQ